MRADDAAGMGKAVGVADRQHRRAAMPGGTLAAPADDEDAAARRCRRHASPRAPSTALPRTGGLVSSAHRVGQFPPPPVVQMRRRFRQFPCRQANGGGEVVDEGGLTAFSSAPPGWAAGAETGRGKRRGGERAPSGAGGGKAAAIRLQHHALSGIRNGSFLGAEVASVLLEAVAAGIPAEGGGPW